MDNEQMKRLSKLLEEGFKPYIAQLVSEAVAEIPFRIRQYVQEIEREAIYKAVTKEIEKGMYITIKVKETP